MNKKLIIEKLIQEIESEIPGLISAARATYDAATNEESRPENEYDTRGLEASYLAGAQAKRVAEIEKDVHELKQVVIADFANQDVIRSTALIELEYSEKKYWVFLLPRGGGRSIEVSGLKIQVITPTSPLGEALIGLGKSDVAVVESDSNAKEYEVLQIL